MAAQQKAGRLIKEICSFSERVLHGCPTGPWHRCLSPSTFPNPSLSWIHTSLDTRWIFVFSHHDNKFQAMDTFEGLYGGPLVSLYPPAAWIHHCIFCIALKETEKVPANILLFCLEVVFTWDVGPLRCVHAEWWHEALRDSDVLWDAGVLSSCSTPTNLTPDVWVISSWWHTVDFHSISHL